MDARVRRVGDQLFLVGGSNDVLRLFDPVGFDALVSVVGWRERLAAREAFFRGLGVPWCLLLAPEKLSVLGEEVGPGERFVSAVGHSALVNPLGFLREQLAKGYAVYPRTDSRWTPLGALCAFQWAMPFLGVTLDYSPYLDLAVHRLFYHGDLWSSAHADMAPDGFERLAVPSAITRVFANEIVLLKERLGLENEGGLHTGSHTVFRNTAAQRPERLVLFGSSFSDHRVECSLLTFLAALFFREVHFVWSTDLDLGLIERVRPDLVLLEMPERFLPVCPGDGFDVAGHAARVVRDYSSSSRSS